MSRYFPLRGTYCQRYHIHLIKVYSLLDLRASNICWTPSFRTRTRIHLPPASDIYEILFADENNGQVVLDFR